jgi:hypothetical protein
VPKFIVLNKSGHNVVTGVRPQKGWPFPATLEHAVHTAHPSPGNLTLSRLKKDRSFIPPLRLSHTPFSFSNPFSQLGSARDARRPSVKSPHFFTSITTLKNV